MIKTITPLVSAARRRTEFAVLLSLLFVVPVRPQSNLIRFDHITTKDGLSQDIVTCIARDVHGFMWFGTEDGLNRYDGYSLRVYKSNPADSTTLPWNSINALLVDRTGRLWVSASGVNRYDERVDGFVRYGHSQSDPHSLPYDHVPALCQDSTGALWAATDLGLARLDERSGHWQVYTHDPRDSSSLSSSYVSALLTDRHGTLWVGTQDGLNRFDAATGKFRRYLSTGRAEPGRSKDAIAAIFEYHDGTIWLGTNGGGLMRFDPRTGAARRYRSGDHDPRATGSEVLFAINEDRRGRLWIGHYKGLDVLNPATGVFEHYGQSADDPDAIGGERIYAIYRDDKNAMWLGSYHGGVERFDPHRHKFGLYRSVPVGTYGLIEENIYSIIEDFRGRVWIGTESGIALFKPVPAIDGIGLGPPLKSPKTSAGAVVALFEDSRHDIWVGHDKPGILERFNSRGDMVARYPYRGVQTITEDETGVMWFGTLEEGIVRYSPADGRATVYRNNPEYADSLWGDGSRCLYADKRGSVWIGTNTGKECVNRFDVASRRFEHYSYNVDDTNSMPGADARAIYKDSVGNYWFGFWGSGLTKYEQAHDRYTRYYDKDGLASNYVKGILADSRNRLWISTEKGISRLNPKTGIFRNYTTADGLQGDRFWSGSAMRSKNGFMYFGGNHGLNVFHPDSIRDDSAPPPVLITNFKVFDKPLGLGDAIWNVPEVDLSYRQDFISFEFVALDYSSSDRNVYAYKMEGFDNDWVQAGSRRYAAYTHLNGGTYTFRVKAANSDGVWNENGASIRIVIHPPYWETIWFRLLAVLVVAGILYSAYRIRLARVLAVEKLRQRIAQDLHDDVGTNLSAIALASRSVARKRATGKASKEVLERIGSVAQRTTDQMRDIVWVLKTSNDSLGDIVAKMREVAGQLLGGIRYTFEGSADGLPGSVNLEFKRNIFLFYKECLNNVVKHSGATKVTISLGYSNGELRLNVQDNGRGFDEKSGSSGSGLQNLRERARLMKGTVTISSERGRGTDISLFVKMTHMRYGLWGKGGVG